MEFRVLGPLEVVAARGPVGLGSLQQRALLALLVVSAPEALSRDRVVDELWGERPPPSAEHAVQVYVSRIRKFLGQADGAVRVRSVASEYSLDLEADSVDARRFERLVDEAERALADDPAMARALFTDALGLWRGRALGEFERFAFARLEGERLEELRGVAVAGLVEARLGLGEHVGVIGEISRLVAANPLRERPRQLLMLALYRSGRHAEALDAYRDAVAAFDEIGLQPGPELRALEEAILRHDASLAVPGSGEAGTHVEVNAVDRSMSVSADGSAAPVGVVVGGAESPSVRRRKVVTALFCDVTGSTALGEELDPEVLHGVMNRYWRELRAVIERHGGAVEKFIGDAVVAIFGIPQVREDDALRAVRAANEIRQRIPVVAEEVGIGLTFRTAVNTGLVLVGEGENLAIGDAVNVAARLEQAAEPGEILLGEETLRLIRDAVEVEPLESLSLKGKSAPVRAFRLLGMDPLAPGLARHLDRPLIGRTRELELLRGAWERTVREGGCHLFTLLGVAGVGKSRLVSELLTGLDADVTVLSGRCLHYGEGITFWPLVEALNAVGDTARPLLDRLATGGAATPEELFWDVRRLLESLALERPLIIHIDDLQWAEPMLLDLLDHVVELARGVPILLLCTARPELLEDRRGWGGGKLNATTVLLDSLGPEECEALLTGLNAGLRAETRARIIAASEGNPLFLEEMTALAREQGSLAVPSTIQALLVARLERLAAQERELLECGAIEGEVFHRGAVGALLPRDTATQVDVWLTELVRHELIRPHLSTFAHDDAYRFRHLLIRDAAYAGLPKGQRAELHERFASWLIANGHELNELDELVGWHLEQTVHNVKDLAKVPDPGLALRAAEHLRAAGRRATARGDAAAARKLLERAHDLVPADSRLGAEIGVDLAEQLLDTGDLTRVDQLLSAAERDPATTALASVARLEWLRHTQPQAATEVIEPRLPDLLRQLSRSGDELGLAKGHMVAFGLHWMACRATAAGRELRAVAEHARNAGDMGLRSRALGQYIMTLMYGSESAEAVARQLAEIEAEDLGPFLAAHLELGRAELQRLQGNLPETRRLAHRAIDGFGSLGMGVIVGGLEQHLGHMELMAGQAAAAIDPLLRSDEILANLGERDHRSTTQAMLAEAYEELGQLDKARAAIALSDELGAADDVANLTITYRIRARIALSDGDAVAAAEWAQSAVNHASQTDFPLFQAQTRLELARILAAINQPQAAVVETHSAIELFEAKGDHPGAAEARALLATNIQSTPEHSAPEH